MSITSAIQEITSSLPTKTRLVAVSKFQPIEKIREAYYQSGQRVFGESRVQELSLKAEQLPKDIEWHFIGHLQKNKIKSLLPIVSLIHSVDSEELLRAIHSEAIKINREIKVLLQIHIAKEKSKFGFSFEECRKLFENSVLSQFPSIKVVGLMGMATNTEDEEEIREEFSSLQQFLLSLKHDFHKETLDFTELSMGMSNDYPLAIEYGSTLVRIGSKIFGERG
ncbi:MAG TPA: YggS family pyridoxal phosphate-dependent enzyme [Porphyromonadaceae bacterium]|nr:YggS family pyridoxal phosphate-dependent enzyme [Porphyromonadaceae bacterium]